MNVFGYEGLKFDLPDERVWHFEEKLWQDYGYMVSRGPAKGRAVSSLLSLFSLRWP